MANRVSSTDKDVDLLFNTMANILYATSTAHGGHYWPYHPVKMHLVTADYFFAEMVRLFRRLEALGYGFEDIARLFKNPNRVADYNFMWGYERDLLVEDRYYLASSLVRILRVLRNGDPFCETGSSLVWAPDRLSRELEGAVFLGASDRGTLQLLSRLETLLTSYAELVYYMYPGFSRMYHGPYSRDDQTIFVKEFIDLKSVQLWKFAGDFPFQHYRSIGLYDKKLKIKVYFVGLFETNVPFIEALNDFSVQLDGVQLHMLEEIKGRTEEVESVISRGIDELSQCSEEELFHKGIEMLFYTLKPLYDAAGEECVVPQGAYDTLSERLQRAEMPRPWGDLTEDQIIAKLLRFVDFRRRIEA